MKKLITINEVRQMEKIKFTELEVQDERIVVAEHVPFDELYRLAQTIVEQITTENENGMKDISFSLLDMVERSLFYVDFSNIDFEDLSLIGVFDWMSLSLSEEQAYLTDIPAYNILRGLVYNSIREVEAENRNFDARNRMYRTLEKRADAIGAKLEAMVERTDPNKVAKYMSGALNIIAKKLPDVSDPDKAVKTLSSFQKALNKKD